MLEIFVQVLADLQKKEEVEKYLLDLLSPTEKTMLAKRLLTAFLLSKGYSYEAICDLLKISRATIGKIALWLKIGKGEGFDLAINRILSKQEREDFLREVRKLLAKFLTYHPTSRRKIDYYFEKQKKEAEPF